jgi:hypothetical protein
MRSATVAIWPGAPPRTPAPKVRGAQPLLEWVERNAGFPTMPQCGYRERLVNGPCTRGALPIIRPSAAAYGQTKHRGIPNKLPGSCPPGSVTPISASRWPTGLATCWADRFDRAPAPPEQAAPAAGRSVGPSRPSADPSPPAARQAPQCKCAPSPTPPTSHVDCSRAR